jgi:predicted  nucleic acid-binding Zn-ribbon protein
MSDEPAAKKACVEMKPSNARIGTTSSNSGSTSSSDERVDGGSNRDGAVVEASSIIEGEHNYSITNRWRKRSEKWRQWKDGKVFANNFDLNSLQLLTGQELFMTIDESSPLGIELVAFAATMQDCKRNVQDSKGEIQTFMGDIQTFEQDIAQFSREIKSLETQKINLATQVETLNEQMSSMPTAAIMGRIEDKRALLASKTSLIAITTKLIAGKRERIADTPKLIATETEKVQTITKNIDELISSISLAHEGMRNKFSYVTNKGNKTVETITSKEQSVDSRIDMTRTSSPSDFDMFRSMTEATFRDDLIGLVTEKDKVTLGLFQTFVADLFNNADSTDDSKLVKETTDAILAWEGETTVNKAVRYARPPTTEDKETKADHPILHAVICRIIGILVAESSDSSLHKYEHGISTQQSVTGFNVGNKKGRRIDAMAHRREEYLALVLLSMVKQPIEIKSAPSSKGKFNKAVETGRLQILGHLGKRLLYTFDFGMCRRNLSHAFDD